MENKQTAVEWLKKELEEYGSNLHLNLDWTTFDELIDQAKEMEKENTKKLLEIIMWYDEESDVRPNTEIYTWFKQYYNEMYGK